MGSTTSRAASSDESVEASIKEIREIATKEINALTVEKDIPVIDGRNFDVQALEVAMNRVMVHFKKELKGVNKEVMSKTAYDLGIMPSETQMKEMAPSIEQIRKRVLDFYVLKYKAILHALDNLTIGCRDEQKIINKNFARIVGPRERVYKNTPVEEINRINQLNADQDEAESRLLKLNNSAKEYYSSMRSQLRKLRGDIDYATMVKIDIEIRKIIDYKFGTCCTNIYNLRNFYWVKYIPGEDEKDEDNNQLAPYFYNPIFPNIGSRNDMPSSLEESGGLQAIGALSMSLNQPTVCPINRNTLEKIAQNLKKGKAQLKRKAADTYASVKGVKKPKLQGGMGPNDDTF